MERRKRTAGNRLPLMLSRFRVRRLFGVFSSLPRRKVVVEEREPAAHKSGGGSAAVAVVPPVEEPKTHRPRHTCIGSVQDVRCPRRPCEDRREDHLCQEQTSVPPRGEDDDRAGLRLQSRRSSHRRVGGESSDGQPPRPSIDRLGKALEDGRSRPAPGRKLGEAPEPRHIATGRLGEAAVYQYLVERLGPKNVRWVNQDSESELPYDIVVTTKGGGTEYVEVKATVHPERNWFEISAREWEFMVEKGDSFSVARVQFLSGESSRASITMLRDPLRLCQQEDLNLALCMGRKSRGLLRDIGKQLRR